MPPGPSLSMHYLRFACIAILYAVGTTPLKAQTSDIGDNSQRLEATTVSQADIKALFESPGSDGFDRPPGMIGDFFGASAQQINMNAASYLGPSFRSSVLYGPYPAPMSIDHGLNTWVPTADGGEFVLLPGTFSAALPGTAFAFVGPVGPRMTLTSGSPAYQAALKQVLITHIGDEVELLGGEAIVNSDPSLPANTYYFVYQHFNYRQLIELVPRTFEISASPGASVGRLKVADQNSAIPRDRINFDYGLFHGAAVANQAVNVNRFSTGFEKTVLTDLTSVEVRVPMAATLSSNTVGEPGAQLDVSHYEIGNLAFVLKQVLYTNEQFWLTGGLGIQTPTADDITISTFSGVDLLRVRNQSVRLQPYLATLHQTQNWFWQNFLQVDVCVSGNEVLVNNRNAMQYLGTLNDQNFIYMDTSLSRWMYRDRQREIGFAATGELHYSRSIQDNDSISANGYLVGTPGFQSDILNATFGLTSVIGKTNITTAYGTPLTSDRSYDGQLRVMLNRNF